MTHEIRRIYALQKIRASSTLMIEQFAGVLDGHAQLAILPKGWVNQLRILDALERVRRADEVVQLGDRDW
jgi:hypothetical protein